MLSHWKSKHTVTVTAGSFWTLLDDQAFCVDIEGDHQVVSGDQQDDQDGLPVGAGAPHAGLSVVSLGEVTHSACLH